MRLSKLLQIKKAGKYPIKRDEEVVKLANDTPFGLTAFISTKDAAKGMRMASEIEAGGITVNTGAMSRRPRGGVAAAGPNCPWAGISKVVLARMVRNTACRNIPG